MEFLKEILFWWMLIDNIVLIFSKAQRTIRINYLKKLDSLEANNFTKERNVDE